VLVYLCILAAAGLARVVAVGLVFLKSVLLINRVVLVFLSYFFRVLDFIRFYK